VMHLYHHAYEVPEGRYGMNYGISLSLWDYIFKTNYVPEDSGNAEIGFKGDDQFPTTFVAQNLYGFKKGQK
jgi:sterol desaturase/sphingolipid hydroxylase (fatty acid hydroxylase superfamily)